MKALLIVFVVVLCVALILGPAVISSVNAIEAKAESNIAAACANSATACGLILGGEGAAQTVEGGR